ncbi:ankyrin repeat-containing domain protein [Baffinella frigidus]|nr:ankyrin repeat-containing domain protein [Cryptophyta sp. CCMP2293]
MGWTKLHHAVLEGDTASVRSLLAEISTFHLKNAYLLDAKDKIGATALHWACSEGYDEIVVSLLEAGADKDARDNQGRSPLHYAVRQSNADVVSSLLAASVDTHAQDNNGLNPLLGAALAGQHANVGMLLQAGAVWDSKEALGGTPLIQAENRAKVLREAGACTKTWALAEHLF